MIIAVTATTADVLHNFNTLWAGVKVGVTRTQQEIELFTFRMVYSFKQAAIFIAQGFGWIGEQWDTVASAIKGAVSDVAIVFVQIWNDAVKNAAAPLDWLIKKFNDLTAKIAGFVGQEALELPGIGDGAIIDMEKFIAKMNELTEGDGGGGGLITLMVDQMQLDLLRLTNESNGVQEAYSEMVESMIADFDNLLLQGTPSEEIHEKYDLFTAKIEELKVTSAQATEEIAASFEKMGKSIGKSVEKTAKGLPVLNAAQAAVLNDFAGQSQLLLQNLEDAGMKQTGLYKTMFVVQKAFAIAQAINATHLAANNALALGPVVGPPLSAAMLTLGYANVAVMVGTAIAGFEGGGLTPNKPRTGGVDGRGGMMAVLHPNEKITDMANGGGGELQVVINNFGNDEVTAEKDEATGIIEIAVGRAIRTVANDIATGNGSVSRSLESSAGFGLRRRGA